MSVAGRAPESSGTGLISPAPRRAVPVDRITMLYTCEEDNQPTTMQEADAVRLRPA